MGILTLMMISGIVESGPITYWKGKTMTPNEYQAKALRTASGMHDDISVDPIVNCALGLTGEAGEVADLVKKHIFQGHDLDEEHFAKELGDVLWYVAVGASLKGYSLEQIMAMNIQKLRDRYPDGFEAERSLNRAEGDI